jgi:hypothetical protein
MNTKTNTIQNKLDDRTVTLAEFLDCAYDDIDAADFPHPFNSNNCYSFGNQEYMVLTDSEADEAVTEYIKESVWAFNADFLASMTELDSEMFALASDKCESANDAILRTIEKTCGLAEFVEQAVSADGRGHFLSGYDGEEVEQGNYFIYRTN